VAGVDTPDAGTVTWGSESLLDLLPRHRARLLAYLPQQAVLAWDLRVEQVVALGRLPHLAFWQASDASHPAVRSALQSLSIDHLVGRMWRELSGGERQLVAIARLLASQAPVLLLDEPFASLDPAWQLMLAEKMRDWVKEGLTILVICHDVPLASRFADKLMVMQGGRLIAEGKAQDVLAPSQLEKIYGVSAIPVTHEGMACILPWSHIGGIQRKAGGSSPG
jgi:iron complex transport system ATP-binding protein